MGIHEDLDEINFGERVDKIAEYHEKATHGSEETKKTVQELREIHRDADAELEEEKQKLMERGRYDEVYSVLGQLVKRVQEIRSLISEIIIAMRIEQDKNFYRWKAYGEVDLLNLSLIKILQRKATTKEETEELEEIKSKMNDLERDIEPLQEEGIRWLLDELKQSLSEIAHPDIDLGGEEDE